MTTLTKKNYVCLSKQDNLTFFELYEDGTVLCTHGGWGGLLDGKDIILDNNYRIAYEKVEHLTHSEYKERGFQRGLN